MSHSNYKEYVVCKFQIQMQIQMEVCDMDTCDYSKQRLESDIAPEIQNDTESEVTDVCVCVC